MDLTNLSTEDVVKQLLARELARDEEATKKAEAEKQAQFVTMDALRSLFDEHMEKVQKAVEEQVEKAMPVRSEGAGRVGQEQPASDPLNENPVLYLANKAARGEELTDDEKALKAAITTKIIGEGLLG